MTLWRLPVNAIVLLAGNQPSRQEVGSTTYVAPNGTVVSDIPATGGNQPLGPASQGGAVQQWLVEVAGNFPALFVKAGSPLDAWLRYKQQLNIITSDRLVTRNPPRIAGISLGQIVREVTEALFGFSYRSDAGLWSQGRGRNVTRHEFVNFVSSRLMGHAASAIDVPRTRDGDINRGSLIRAVKNELEIVWSDLSHDLPPLEEANLGPDAPAAKEFQEAMVRLWIAPRTFEIAKTVQGTSGETIAARASLISRVKSQAKPYLDKNQACPARNREFWREVQPSFAAWWRPFVYEGEMRIFLAMRWQLAGQIQIELPGVTSQSSLTALGYKFGALDPRPPVTDKLSLGKARLAVLSRDLTDELMAEPEESGVAEPDSEELDSERDTGTVK